MPARWQILLVEDDPVTCAELDLVFRARGLEVTTASTPAEAIRLLTENRYVAIVLDLVLHEGSGITLLEAMHQQGWRYPVIVTTRYLSDFVQQISQFFPQVKLIVAKPFPAATLADNVATLAGLPRTA